MKTKTAGLGILGLVLCLAGSAQAWDFSYDFNNVTATNADTYIVGQENVRKYVEWQDPPETYWGALPNGTPGKLTLRFDFSGPTKEVFLKAKLVSANHQFYYGNSSLWASKDGASWQLLLNNPTPSEGLQEKVYAEKLPDSLLGSRSLWVQARLQQWNSPPTVSDSQFGRNDPSSTENLFELKARLGKGAQAASSPAVARGAGVGTFWLLPCVLLALALGFFACVCALAALVCALVRPRSPGTAPVQALEQRLAKVERQLHHLEQPPEHRAGR